MTPTLLAINNYHYRRGGAEVLFFEENQILEGSGWEVVPFSMRHSENLPSKWSEYFVDEIEFGEAYSFVEKLTRVPKVIYSREAQAKLCKLLAKVKPSVAHAHNVYHHLSPSIFKVLKQHGIPTVLTLHDKKLVCPAYSMLTHDGICERCKSGALFNVVIHRCLKDSLALSALALLEAAVHRRLNSYGKNVDRFVVPSRFFIDKFVEWGWERGRFTYVPNFVDTDIDLPKKGVGKAFIYIGRLVPEKGLGTLVRAAAQAEIPVWLAGAGPMKEELERLVEQLGADVTFVGNLSKGELHAAIGQARAAVLPSETYENCPLALLDSYALARPVIGARLGGIPELIREGETGLTFESGDVGSLARSLRYMSDLPDRRVAEMGQAGRELVEADFTADAYRDRLLAVFRDAGAEC